MELVTERFVLKEINQICVVVKDLKSSMESYWKLFRLGPWSVYTFAPPELTDTIVRGKPKKHSMKIALTNIGPLMFELIQPLEGESIYKEFLEKKGYVFKDISTDSNYETWAFVLDLSKKPSDESQGSNESYSTFGGGSSDRHDIDGSDWGFP